MFWNADKLVEQYGCSLRLAFCAMCRTRGVLYCVAYFSLLLRLYVSVYFTQCPMCSPPWVGGCELFLALREPQECSACSFWRFLPGVRLFCPVFILITPQLQHGRNSEWVSEGACCAALPGQLPPPSYTVLQMLVACFLPVFSPVLNVGLCWVSLLMLLRSGRNQITIRGSYLQILIYGKFISISTV